MKILLTIALVLCSLQAFAQSDQHDGETANGVAFKTLVIERIDIPYDSRQLFIFEFKNTGTVPLIITAAKSSCGCVVAEKPNEPIAPGKSAEIRVKYDTRREGRFVKTVTVQTSASQEPVLLTIKGNVLPHPESPVEVVAPEK